MSLPMGVSDRVVPALKCRSAVTFLVASPALGMVVRVCLGLSVEGWSEVVEGGLEGLRE